jgi:hypothetical protein
MAPGSARTAGFAFQNKIQNKIMRVTDDPSVTLNLWSSICQTKNKPRIKTMRGLSSLIGPAG